MKIILSTLKKILFWSYERGSWQYDVMCVLILAFILLSPNKAFDQPASNANIIPRRELRQVAANDIESEIGAWLEKKYGHPVKISRIEEAEDSSGGVYIVWTR